MGLLRNVAIVVLSLTIFVFVALFGRIPALRNTPISFLHRLVWVSTPRALRYVDEQVTGGVISPATARLGHYLMYEKHNIVLIFFLGLLSGSIMIFLSGAWFQLGRGHQFAILLIVPLPYAFTYLCIASTAGTITATNHAEHMQTYPFDHTLYHPGQHCRTCQWVKPARSKHCSICRACIGRFDHHCVWINNCVTKDNLRWFLALLCSLVLVLLYGSCLAYLLLWPQIKAADNVSTSRSFLTRLSIVLAQNRSIGSVGLLALLSSPLATGLLSYHIYLIWAGITTNETQKWGDLKLDMTDGVVWKGHKSVVYQNDLHTSTGTGHEPPTSWPVSSDQVIVRTVDGRAPVFGRRQKDTEPNNDWTRCWTLSEVENIYDLGFLDNLRDALDLAVT